eukprot:COSAG02_NODE_790_length_17186_cov_791.824603_5_plen_51_part_00
MVLCNRRQGDFSVRFRPPDALSEDASGEYASSEWYYVAVRTARKLKKKST